MALGERFRSGGARGIAQFLAEHQHCESGFDVRRDEAPGSGKLTITCRGCGKTVSYNGAEIGDVGAFDLPEDVHTRTEDRGPIGRAPADATAENGAEPPGRVRTRRPRRLKPPPASPRRQPRSGGGLPRWVVPAATGLLIAAGVAIIAIGLIRSGGDGETSEEPPAPTTGRGARRAHDTGAEEPAPPAEPPPPGGVALRNRFYGNFTVGVPAGWTASTEPDGATLEAPRSTAGLSVIAGGSTLSPLEFAQQSEAFLASRREGAGVGQPKPVTFQGRPAARTIVSYPGGEEQVTFVSSGDTVYVLDQADRARRPGTRCRTRPTRP